MGAHYNLNTTYGVTLPAGAVPQSAERNRTVEISEVVGTSGEFVKADPLKTAKVEISVSGVGPAGLSGVTSGNVSAPSSITINSAEQGEGNKGRSTFSIKAAGFETVTSTGGGGSAGSEPDIDTLEIVSVSYACVETVKRTANVTDLMQLGSDSTPFARGKCKRFTDFDIAGRGDLPSGLVIGSGGASLAGLSGGKLIVASLKEMEKAGDWNGYGGSGKHYHLAA